MRINKCKIMQKIKVLSFCSLSCLLFISSFFLPFSQHVSALSSVFREVGVYYTTEIVNKPYWAFAWDSSFAPGFQGFECNVGRCKYIFTIGGETSAYQTRVIKQNDIFEFTLFTNEAVSVEYLDTAVFSTSGTPGYYKILDFQQDAISVGLGYTIIHVMTEYTGPTKQITTSWVPLALTLGTTSTYGITPSMQIANMIHWSIADEGASNADIQSSIEQLKQQSVTNSQNEVNAINGVADAINKGREEDNNAMNQAQGSADNSADSSSAEAESSGTSLLKAFIDFVGAITNVNPTNCVLNGNLGIGDFSIGQLDLCAYDPPSIIQTLSSLVMIGFFVPISIFTAKKMINLFRSFTNG